MYRGENMFRCRVPAVAGVVGLALSVGALTFPAFGAEATVTPAPVLALVGERASAWGPAPRMSTAALAATDTTSTVVRDGVTLLRVRTSVDRSRVTGKGPTRSDFDGDGRDDVAVSGYGFVDELGDSDSNSAGIVVMYSSARYRDRITTRVGEFGGSPAGDGLTAGDFDGDGYDDLVFNSSSEYDYTAKVSAGGVWIVPGGPDGLDISAARHVNQSTRGVPGTSVADDSFGSSLAAGDVTGDGRDELLIGIPYKTVKGKVWAGSVIVLKGSATGLTTSGAKAITQNTAGVPGVAEKRDRFGAGITVGPLNKGRYRDVVIGAPGEQNPDFGGGMVTQFWGSKAGLSFKNVSAVTGDTIVDVAQTRSGYAKNVYVEDVGAQLAIADTNGDDLGEVIIGVPLGADGNTVASGVVVTLPVRRAGLYAKGLIVLGEQDKNIAGAAAEGDLFGASIASGDITGDGYDDVLVGAPGNAPSGKQDAGAVVLLRGSSKGLTGVKSQAISQSSAGVPGATEKDDRFGSAVAVLNLDGTRRLDAAITAPAEAVGGDTKGQPSGSVTIMRGVSSGLSNGTVFTGRAVGLPGLTYGENIAHR
jgi:hypothetical protein